MDRTAIANQLRNLRRDRGKTQEEVANSIGVSPAAYAMYETGERVPRDDIKERLAEYFNVSVGSLFFKENHSLKVD